MSEHPYNYFYPTYTELHNACVDACDDCFKHIKLTKVVGIVRGGLLPAVIVSHKLDLPLIPISYSSKRGKGDDKSYSNVVPVFDKSDCILIVDDISDSGLTLKELVDIYQSQGVTVITYTLYAKLFNYEPDYYSWIIEEKDRDEWVFFPWEPR